MTDRRSFSLLALNGGTLLLASSCLRLGIQFVVSVLVARVLGKAAFGALAIIFSFLAIFQVIAEFGVAAAVVQRKELPPLIRDSAFFLNLISSFIGAASLFLIAPLIAEFYRNESLVLLFRIATGVLLLHGLFSFSRSLLLRGLRYRAVALTEGGSALAGGVLTVALLMMGGGIASVVWGECCAAAIQVGVGSTLVSLRFESFGSLCEMRRLLGFGSWVALSRGLEHAAGQFDKYVLGRFVSASDLGVYYLAYRISTLLPALMTSVIDQVLFPIYSRWQQDSSLLEQGYWLALRVSAMLVLPVAILLGVFAEPLIIWVFGSQWSAAVPITRLLAISGAIQGLGGGIFSSIICATGHPRSIVWVGLCRVVLLPFCVMAGVAWNGIVGAAVGMVAWGIMGRILNQLILRSILKFSLRRYFRELMRPVAVGLGSLLAGIFLLFLMPIGTSWTAFFILLPLEAILVLSLHLVLSKWFLSTEYRYIRDYGHRIVTLMKQLKIVQP